MLVSLPGYVLCCHIGIYMPTSGLDAEFLDALSSLESTIEMIVEQYGSSLPLFIRGDMNVNPNNKKRVLILQKFLSQHDLESIKLLHPSYHHLTGFGEFDSSLDVLLYSRKFGLYETLVEQVCKLKHPLLNSHHDLIVSTATIPCASLPPSTSVSSAPKISNNRTKILWSEEGIEAYQSVVGDFLQELGERWSKSDSRTSISILLETTNSVLQMAATETNRFIDLSKETKQKKRLDPELKLLRNNVLNIHKEKKKILQSADPDRSTQLENIQQRLTSARSLYSREIYKTQQQSQNKRDQEISDLLNSCPNKVYDLIRREKAESSQISVLKVGSTVYTGDNVCDGFYHSLSQLKSPDMYSIENSAAFSETKRDYENIIELVKIGQKLPEIDIYDCVDILFSVRKDVNDIFSITASHFINAGAAGIRHFHLLMSSIISNIINASLNEPNDIWAMIL